MNVDLLYLVPLIFGNDLLPAFIHLLFGWGTGYLVYRYLKKQAGRIWGLLGLLVFVSTPMIIRLSITAYVDLGMIFFTTASVLAYFAVERRQLYEQKMFPFLRRLHGAGCRLEIQRPHLLAVPERGYLLPLRKRYGKTAAGHPVGRVFFLVPLPWSRRGL